MFQFTRQDYLLILPISDLSAQCHCTAAAVQNDCLCFLLLYFPQTSTVACNAFTAVTLKRPLPIFTYTKLSVLSSPALDSCTSLRRQEKVFGCLQTSNIFAFYQNWFFQITEQMLLWDKRYTAKMQNAVFLKRFSILREKIILTNLGWCEK